MGWQAVQILHGRLAMTQPDDNERRHPPRRRDRRGPGKTAPSARRSTRTGQHLDAEPPEVVFDVRLLDGPDGEALAHQQARVLREVTEWLARNSSGNGQAQAQ